MSRFTEEFVICAGNGEHLCPLIYLGVFVKRYIFNDFDSLQYKKIDLVSYCLYFGRTTR